MSGALLDQLEFYFCDLNIHQDKFLKGIIETNDGHVPIDTILKFVKIEEMGVTKEDIIRSVEKSNMIEITQNNSSIKRKTRIPSDDEINTRSLFVKNFPKDVKRNEVFECVGKFGKIEAVRMNFNKSSRGPMFNGTCFIEFVSVEDMEKFKNSGCKFEGKTLEFKPRSERMVRENKGKKTADNLNFKLEVSLKVTNRDIKNIIKNEDLLRENITKYFVERTLSLHNMKHGKESDRVEPEGEAKNQEEKGFKLVYVSVRNNSKTTDVRRRLEGLKFFGENVKLSECNREDNENFKKFAVPEKSNKNKKFGGRNDKSRGGKFDGKRGSKRD